jgi:hypothetical protein
MSHVPPTQGTPMIWGWNGGRDGARSRAAISLVASTHSSAHLLPVTSLSSACQGTELQTSLQL